MFNRIGASSSGWGKWVVHGVVMRAMLFHIFHACGRALAGASLCLCATSAEAADIPLDRAINLALSQNRQLIQASHQLDVSQADLDAADAGFDIQVTPALTEQRVGGTVLKNYGVTLSKKLPTGGTVSLSVTRGDTVLPDGVLIVQPAVNLSLQQPLFKNAGPETALYPVRAAESKLTSSKRRYAQARQDLVSRVVEAYAALHELDQQVKLDVVNVEQTTELSRITREYALVGRAKTLDSLRTDFQLDQVRGRLTADQQRLTAARAELAELMGMPPDAAFDTDSVAWLDYQSLDSQQAVQVALSNRLDYAQAMQDYDDTLQSLSVARNQTLPGVDVTVGYQRYSSSPLPGSGVTAGGGAYVGLSSDLGGSYASEKAAVRKADAQRAAALEELDLMQEQITREVQQGIFAYQEARAAEEIALHAAQDAAARLQLARELFHMGRADSFAVTDAAEALVASQSASLSADTDVVRAGYKLSLILGTLVAPPDELKPRS